MTALYLASGSPRRRELLTQIGIPFTVVGASIDETPLVGERPEDYVVRLALGKAEAGLAALGDSAVGAVLGADTAVVLDGRILGKPLDRADALAMLAALSGREHEVLTAVAVVAGPRRETLCVSSRVTFCPISAEQASAYWASGEPCDKAGAYAIQGLGGVFVKNLHGSYSAVVGLPVSETAQLLDGFGIACWQGRFSA